MSRSNPAKQKKRQAKKTLLIVGEGQGEEMVLRYFRSLYGKNAGVSVKIIKGKGGSAQSIVSDANRMIGAFDRRVVVLDNDKSEQEMNEARKFAKTKKIHLIENAPCLEHLLLDILESAVPATQSSSWYKDTFEAKYIDKKKRGDMSEYAKHFPKSLLDAKRKTLPVLDAILTIIEGGKID